MPRAKAKTTRQRKGKALNEEVQESNTVDAPASASGTAIPPIYEKSDLFTNNTPTAIPSESGDVNDIAHIPPTSQNREDIDDIRVVDTSTGNPSALSPRGEKEDDSTQTLQVPDAQGRADEQNKPLNSQLPVEAPIRSTRSRGVRRGNKAVTTQKSTSEKVSKLDFSFFICFDNITRIFMQRSKFRTQWKRHHL